MKYILIAFVMVLAILAMCFIALYGKKYFKRLKDNYRAMFMKGGYRAAKEEHGIGRLEFGLLWTLAFVTLPVLTFFVYEDDEN